MPVSGNLAWAPIPSVDEVDIFDRHNGVPTLGVIRAADEVHLFWRVVGYTGDISVWLYIPLSLEEQRALTEQDGLDLLAGIVYQTDSPRFATVGVADLNRLVFEREWHIPADLAPDEILRPVLDFVNEALSLALEEGLPPTRREGVEKAQGVVRHLVDC